MRSLSEISLTPPAPAARNVQEQQARGMAASLGGHNARSIAGTPRPAELEGGAPLAAPQREALGSHLQSDFSHVRVHTDTAGAEAAEAVGARAFTFGSDIVFGAGQPRLDSPAGQALLAHELTHTLQHSKTGQRSIQMDGKDGKGGIGSAPPKEPFTSSSEPAAEDGFVLFSLDSADCPARDLAKIKAMLAPYKGSVTVQVHGYASSEGADEYNINLAAHRAAAVKRAIEKQLPAGSKVVLVSHGLTTAFGPLEKNRRVGIKITDGVDEPPPEKKTPGDSPTVDPNTKPPDPKPFTGLGHYHLDPLPPPGLLLPPGGTGPGLRAPLGDIDWHAIAPKFSLRGERLDGRDIEGITQHWTYSYNWFRAFVPHDLAVKGANLAVPFVTDSWLAREHPNRFDAFQTAIPNAKPLIIPLTDILDGILKYKLNLKKGLTEF